MCVESILCVCVYGIPYIVCVDSILFTVFNVCCVTFCVDCIRYSMCFDSIRYTVCVDSILYTVCVDSILYTVRFDST